VDVDLRGERDEEFTVLARQEKMFWISFRISCAARICVPAG
jgi:hypothetical protein